MTVPFTIQQGAIGIDVEVEGPLRTVNTFLVLDTGASTSMISPHLLVLAGHDPAHAVSHQPVITASGVVSLPLVFTKSIRALGHQRTGFCVVAHTLPAGTSFQGVLGLDFFAGTVLCIDFRQGTITLT